MYFKDLSLIEPLLRALESVGYEQPTPIQQQSIPIVLARRDLLGCAQTGTGKTAAFALPMLQLLSEQPRRNEGKTPIRALILTPTRELAIQIAESFNDYGKFLKVRNLVIFGGVNQNPQTDALRRGTEVLIATPGRLLDLMNQGFINLKDIEIFVLDEADRMLDMGFIHDVKRVIAKLPEKRQTLFFSATMPPEIAGLADSILTDPMKVEVTPVSSTAEKIEQSVYFVDKANKRHLLAHLLQNTDIRSALVFTRTKHGANRVAGDLTKAGVKAEAIHGNKSQSARQAALANFKSGKTRVLVATDIAARGIDIDELSHVINFDLPNIPETYVHRIGRTGRAGLSGIAFSFCEEEEVPYLRDIQKLIGQVVPVVTDHPYAADLSVPAPGQPAPKKQHKPLPKRPQPLRKPAPDQPRHAASENRDNQQQKPERQHNRPAPQPGNGGASAERPPQHRRPERPQREERRPRPQQEERKPRPQERPAPNNRREEPRQQPRPQQRQESKPVTTDAPIARKGRFASILEVASIEKQERPRKPGNDRKYRK